jgi:hypothetical protein
MRALKADKIEVVEARKVDKKGIKEKYEFFVKIQVHNMMAEFSVVGYADGTYSFKDLHDSDMLGSHDGAYNTAFRWWELDRKKIEKMLDKEKALLDMDVKSDTRKHFEDIIRGVN